MAAKTKRWYEVKVRETLGADACDAREVGILNRKTTVDRGGSCGEAGCAALGGNCEGHGAHRGFEVGIDAWPKWRGRGVAGGGVGPG